MVSPIQWPRATAHVCALDASKTRGTHELTRSDGYGERPIDGRQYMCTVICGGGMQAEEASGRDS